MNSVVFEIPFEPVGQMRPRRGQVFKGKLSGDKRYQRCPWCDKPLVIAMHKDKKQRARENLIREYIEKSAPADPWNGPVFITLTCYMKMPDSWPKWKRTVLSILPTRKPDLSRMLNHIEDVCTGLIFTDDAVVCSTFMHKRFSFDGEPRWVIKIQEMEDRYRHDVLKRDVDDI